MILRHVIKHFREQEWTAIFLDFLIVVVGVYVGLQVQNWNEARLERKAEAAFLGRLSVDIKEELSAVGYSLENALSARDNLSQAIFIIQSDDADATLTEEQCLGAWQSHFVAAYSFSGLLSVDALLKSRGLEIVSDPDIQLALINYQREMARSAYNATWISRDAKNLVDEFPQVFPRRLQPGDSFGRVSCQLNAMRESPAVRNKLISNHGRMGGIVDRLEAQIALLRELQLMIGERAQK